MNSMSWALERVKEGPAIITLRHRCTVVKGIQTGKNESSVLPLEELMELRAVRWTKGDGDGWEIVVEQMHPQSGAPVRTIWYVNGEDILFVQIASKLSV